MTLSQICKVEEMVHMGQTGKSFLLLANEKAKIQ